MDIPEDMRLTSQYRATLAHKDWALNSPLGGLTSCQSRTGFMNFKLIEFAPSKSD